MEREREREMEPEESSYYDAVIRDRGKWVERQSTGSLLVKGDKQPYQETRQGRLKFYLHPVHIQDTAVSSWSVFVQDVRRQSGRHRHQGGLVIYVLEGEGTTEVDGHILNWKAGDLLLLPIKPGGVAHQHFNKNASAGCRWVAFIYKPYENYIAHYITQLEESPDYRQAENVNKALTSQNSRFEDWKAEVNMEPISLVGHPDQLASENLFDKLMELRDQQRHRREASTWLIRGEELPWELNQHGRMQWYLHPFLAYPSIHTLIFYRQEIPAGSRSGMQRHAGDVVFYIVQGEGYTEVDGVRHFWLKDDVMTLPARPAGITYRHVNTGAEPVLMIGCEPNLVHTIDLDRGAGFEQMQPCPEFRESFRHTAKE